MAEINGTAKLHPEFCEGLNPELLTAYLTGAGLIDKANLVIVVAAQGVGSTVGIPDGARVLIDLDTSSPVRDGELYSVAAGIRDRFVSSEEAFRWPVLLGRVICPDLAAALRAP